MQVTQVFVLTLAEVLDACEEYIKNTPGTMNDKATRNHCHFINMKEHDGDPKSALVEMGFKG